MKYLVANRQFVQAVHPQTVHLSLLLLAQLPLIVNKGFFPL